MQYQKDSKIYEGKAKTVFTIQNQQSVLWMDYKNSLTAFNAQKRGEFDGKGATNRQMASVIFRYLKKNNIPNHWVADEGDAAMICKKLDMIPLEVVMRNRVAGSLAKKFAMEEGAVLEKPLVEFYFKKDELNDPFISDEQALWLKAAKSQDELEQLKKLGLKINVAMTQFFERIGLSLVDFKLEFGRILDTGEIVLGDEISPDSCRLWDLKTGERMDKDRFRRDLGNVEESYKEVLNRILTVWGKEV
jgi:phosphoribosylaminoimidazole-succinocarboxamide synthase